MKRILSSIFMVLAVVGAAFGQTDHGYNLYGQLFGTSTGIGVGFDSRFKTGGVLGYSVGMAFTSISYDDSDGKDGSYSYRDVDSKGISIPFEVNAIMGNRASKFEIGLGATAYLIHRDEMYSRTIFYPVDDDFFDFKRLSDRKKVFRPNIIGTINIGYRLQRKSGFFMKVGLSFLIGDLKCSPLDGVVALPNLCFGYTIPHFNRCRRTCR